MTAAVRETQGERMEPGIYEQQPDGTLKLLKRQCSHPWGIGTYFLPEWGEDGEWIYGYPFGADPHDFTPDRDCVTAAELAAHTAALAACECGR